jgi:hypothetical protein
LISAQKTTVLEEHYAGMNGRRPRKLGEVADVRRDQDAILLEGTSEDVDVRGLAA